MHHFIQGHFFLQWQHLLTTYDLLLSWALDNPQQPESDCNV